MKVYLAALTRGLINDFRPPYVLESFYSISTPNPYPCKDYILDSGLFTFLNSSKKRVINWEYYCDQYADFVKSHNIKNYVEIDADRFIGLEQVEKIRDRLENRIGRQSIPVWHMNRGYDKWIEITKSHKYIAFGAFITDGLKPSQYKYIPKFLADAKSNGCKVHGLGFNNFDWLKVLKFDSVDSSTWLTDATRYGKVHTFNGERIIKKSFPGKRRKSDYPQSRDLQEWIKFVKYAERYL